MAELSAVPHLPEQAPIEAYGNGGFRFAGMSHRGSLLCLPAGIWVWPVGQAGEIDLAALSPVLAAAAEIDLFILGAGRDPWFVPADLRSAFSEAGLGIDAMPTGAAVRTYNILLAERRRIAAALIAVA